jgi:hypothetical protein
MSKKTNQNSLSPDQELIHDTWSNNCHYTMTFGLRNAESIYKLISEVRSR